MAKPIKPAYLKKPRMASVGIQEVGFADFGFVQPIDPRRRPEMMDSRMIQEDHNAVANLSPREINRQFTPGKYSPHYWMESEVRPFNVIRDNEPEDE